MCERQLLAVKKISIHSSQAAYRLLYETVQRPLCVTSGTRAMTT